MTTPDLRDTVAVVTGAGRGIGRAMALLLAEHGAAVVVNDLGVDLAGEPEATSPADDVVAEILAAGGRAIANTDSVADPGGAEGIVQSALDAFGSVDVVVNNAGILRDRIFHRMERTDWEAVIGVHLMGSFYVSRAAAPHFRAQERGSYIHFTSPSGLIGNVGQANYSAAKLGIVGLSKSIALDMQRFGVRSNCISPFAWSRMIGSIPTTTEAQRERVARLRAMTPQTVAPLAVFLASDLSREVTGQVFGVRNNELFLYSQPRPIRSVHRGDGWSPSTIADHALPALRASFYPLDVSADVFSWDPI
jgi:NAD(P)-dependent dehydrogenase (short-subunit alcohol dehydrogenase family)